MQQLNFPMALKEAAALLDRLEAADEAGHASFRSEIDKFMLSEEGCRGFFVVLLTDEREIADEPPAVLVEAIKDAGEIPSSVLARNLVMSAATRVVHERKGDSENAAGSDEVTRRTQTLIRRAASDSIRNAIASMRATLVGESQEFAGFMARVNYDHEQKDVAIKAIDEIFV